MSDVITQLRARRVARSTAPLRRGRRRRASTMTVVQLDVREPAQVVALCPALDDATARRLVDLGITRGAPLEVVRKAPLGGPVVLRVADYEIALRRSLARQVEVVAVASMASDGMPDAGTETPGTL